MTARSKAPDRPAALGMRSHSGWAAYVVLAGNPKAPEILARGRLDLCDAAIAGSKQPFHEAEPMPFSTAEKFIARCAASSAKLAAVAIGDLAARFAPKACCVLTASGRPLPDLRGILASHSAIHAAEGEFYRDVVAMACSDKGIAVRRVRERDMEAEIQALPVPTAAAKARLAEFGKQLGAPWTADEKLCALGAWLMLASLPSRRGPG
ncbi:MAG TPA: hypothetical protein VII56_07630 [Rhizomicrobium sp.]